MSCGRPILSDHESNWYGSALRAAQEEPIYLPPPRRLRATFRFTWLRSFHHPVVVRVDELQDGEHVLTAKELSGEGGYAFGVVDRQVVRPLSQVEATALDNLVAEKHVLDLADTDCKLGVDGARWIIESRTEGGRYRYVNRWAPKEGPADVGRYHFLSFTGWKVGPIY